MYKSELAKGLFKIIGNELTFLEIHDLIEKPKMIRQGDLAFPCFILAKKFKTSPYQIATQISNKLESTLFEKVEVVGGYLNVFLNKKIVTHKLLTKMDKCKDEYGTSMIGGNENVTIDLSSPNIAKPFSMGHLRSTVIGNSIALILKKVGYNPVKINYIGDWGTQFGKLIVAYKKWGIDSKIKQQPIPELLNLYVKFHEEAEEDPTLVQQGRDWFKRLENGNEEAVKLWKWFREESLMEFKKIYKLLGIEFDSFDGESYYNDKMDCVVNELLTKSLLIDSDGAKVVTLDHLKIPPCLIKKSDGATLYATRDLAAAIDRKNRFHFAKSIYVVGKEQRLHFVQINEVLHKMGYEWSKNMVHVSFGLILKEGKKMSTRKGHIILLEEVLKDAISMAQKNVEEKNPNLINKEKVAQQVGVGAVIFHDLKNDRNNDIEFNLQEMIRYDGETAPYVQYTHARAKSILRKAGESISPLTNEDCFVTDEEWPLISSIMVFPDVIQKSATTFDPSLIAKYVIDLSQLFNHYYAKVKILSESKERNLRLKMVASTAIILKEGLRLLGIQAPEEM
jgi:arginyl-tRNA synthetase